MASGATIYRRSLRANVRALWLGAVDYAQFWDAMATTIQRRLPQAWYEGAAEAGVLPAELTPAERQTLQSAIVVEMSYITKLSDAIIAGSKAAGGKLAPLLGRAEMWTSRYGELRIRARAMAAADMKVVWVLGATEVSCTSCLKLAGKVKRNSYWLRTGVLPRVAGAPYLTCAGYKCDCTLSSTDLPLSRGPLPRLP